MEGCEIRGIAPADCLFGMRCIIRMWPAKLRAESLGRSDCQKPNPGSRGDEILITPNYCVRFRIKQHSRILESIESVLSTLELLWSDHTLSINVR
jgi:hypothetical protein